MNAEVITIYGQVENGARLDVDFPFYRGPVGTRVLPDCQLDIAFMGRMPADQVVRGKIAGWPFTTTKIAKSDTIAGMIVATVRPVEWIPDAPEA